LMTPLLMKVLASQFVPIEFWKMMWSVVKIVIIPVAGGLIFNKVAHGRYKWLDDAMPMVSMVGIGVIITIITAAGRDSLLTIGLALILAAIIHNSAGNFLGYWSCRLLSRVSLASGIFVTPFLPANIRLRLSIYATSQILQFYGCFYHLTPASLLTFVLLSGPGPSLPTRFAARRSSVLQPDPPP